MMRQIKTLVVMVCVSGLSSCMVDGGPIYNDYEAYNYANVQWTQNYNTNYSSYTSADSYPTPKARQVTVPESYHVGAYHSPTSPKDRDKNWVSSQNPQAYTIQISEGEKASQVAGTLFKAPKNERTAQVKYQQNGNSYYRGLYGSYGSYQDAQKALDSLPEDLKQGANIKPWGNLQNDMSN